MTEYHFESPEPAVLYVEIGKGSLHVTATDTAETHVDVTGRDADDVRVDQDGDRISVVAPRPRSGFFGGDAGLTLTVTLPLESELAVRTGSAEVTVDGTVGTSQVRTGSGDVRMADVAGPALVETGSGDVQVEVANGELRIKSGSGDIRVRHAESAVAVSTGSGDIEIGTSNGPAAVKTGSGDLRVGEANTDVSMTTASGDLLVGTARRGRFTVKGASANVRIGIPAGTPVWTDISTVSGSVHSDLAAVGEPADEADHVEVRAKTVSGDVVLARA